jgi:HJR/Mrr/RecB family endonuclease
MLWTMTKTMVPLMILVVVARVVMDKLEYEIDSWKISKKFKEGERWRTGREMILWLRNMPPVDFERYTAELFKKLGYKADVVGGINDGGIDVIAEKEGRRHYIQCKRYSSKNEVGVASIRDFYGALVDKVANGKGYIITTGKFSLEAEKFAEGKPIELVDSHRLLEYIRLAGSDIEFPRKTS